MLIALAIAGVCLAVVIAMILTPRTVEYVEAIDVDGAASDVHDEVRHQRDLMRWSAWPSETNSQCFVDGPDGGVGAQTIFLDKKGARFGHQEVTAIQGTTMVAFKLESKGPPHKPTMEIFTIPIGVGRTKVLLHFRNEISPPFHFILRISGVIRWTREMHKKDLGGLKRFIEKRETYCGEKISIAP